MLFVKLHCHFLNFSSGLVKCILEANKQIFLLLLAQQLSKQCFYQFQMHLQFSSYALPLTHSKGLHQHLYQPVQRFKFCVIFRHIRIQFCRENFKRFPEHPKVFTLFFFDNFSRRKVFPPAFIFSWSYPILSYRFSSFENIYFGVCF